MPKPLPVLEDAAPICCAPLGGAPSLSPADAVGLAIDSRPSRTPRGYSLLAYLLDQPDQEGCTCNLAPIVDLSEPTVSHHLKQLEATGLLTKERRGMSVYYRVVPEAIEAIGRVLHVNCC